MAYTNRGVANAALGKLDKAIGDFSEAVKLSPGNALALYNRGNVQFDLGSGVLRYCGPRTDLPQRRRINGVDLSTERGPMRRLPNNKLPLVC